MEAAGELTGQDVLVAVLALVLWPLPFQPFVQVLHLLLLQTLGAGGGGNGRQSHRGVHGGVTWARSALAGPLCWLERHPYTLSHWSGALSEHMKEANNQCINE